MSVFVQPGVRTRFLQGWSGTGVFNIISVTDLTKIQLQLMNEILSLFITPGTGIALPGNFIVGIPVEGGSKMVPLNDTDFRVNLELIVDSFPCKPSVPLMISVLEDLTTMVSLKKSTLDWYNNLYIGIKPIPYSRTSSKSSQVPEIKET